MVPGDEQKFVGVADPVQDAGGVSDRLRAGCDDLRSGEEGVEAATTSRREDNLKPCEHSRR
jgi:hypothetical protein